MSLSHDVKSGVLIFLSVLYGSPNIETPSLSVVLETKATA